MSDTDIQLLIEQLSNKASAKRRSAAKKLRKLKAKEAGPALLTALKNELKDKRTWETQYQLIMALGESKYTDSLNFLTELAEQEFEATMVYVAIGDAITRLDLSKQNNINLSIKTFSKTDNSMLIDGILRAIAMLQLVPEDSVTEKIISYGLHLDQDNNSRVWIAAAAPGWQPSKTKEFLNECIKSDNQQIKRAAEAALKNKYLKWSPL